VDFKYVSEVALKTGRDLTTLSRGYSQIAVAAQEAGISTKEMKNISMSAVEASTAIGLSAADTDGVIRAFVQMLSKGKITAEELRQQLGDRLPIAVPAMARALGLTTEELDKMMEQGEILANESLPKFANRMRKLAREGGAYAAGLRIVEAAQGRLITSLKLAMNTLSESGGKEGIVDIFDTLMDLIVELEPFWKGLGSAIQTVGYIFKNVFGPIFNILKPVFNLLGGILDLTSQFIQKQ